MEGIGGDELDNVDTRKFNVIEKNGNNYGFYFTVDYNKLNESDETIIDLYPTDGCVDNEGSECGDVNEVEGNNNYEEDKNVVCDGNNDNESDNNVQHKKKKKNK